MIYGVPADNAELQKLHEFDYIRAGSITNAGRDALKHWITDHPKSLP